MGARRLASRRLWGALALAGLVACGGDSTGPSDVSGLRPGTYTVKFELATTVATPEELRGRHDFTFRVNAPAESAADFELVAMVNESGEQTVNVSPLTTLAVKAAQCAGNETIEGVNQAWDEISASMNIGLDEQVLGDPMTQAITSDNIETAVLANEAVGELVRRVGAGVAGMGVNMDQVVEVIACDLADNAYDGQLVNQVTADDARVFAVAKAA